MGITVATLRGIWLDRNYFSYLSFHHLLCRFADSATESSRGLRSSYHLDMQTRVCSSPLSRTTVEMMMIGAGISSEHADVGTGVPEDGDLSAEFEWFWLSLFYSFEF